MANLIPIVFAVVLFWKSPDKIATLLALNPLEVTGLLTILGVVIACVVKLMQKFR